MVLQSNNRALPFSPNILAYWSIIPHFTPAKLCSAFYEIKIILFFDKPKLNTSFKPKTTLFSNAADDDMPAPPGIFPAKEILKLPKTNPNCWISATTPKT